MPSTFETILTQINDGARAAVGIGNESLSPTIRTKQEQDLALTLIGQDVDAATNTAQLTTIERATLSLTAAVRIERGTNFAATITAADLGSRLITFIRNYRRCSPLLRGLDPQQAEIKTAYKYQPIENQAGRWYVAANVVFVVAYREDRE